MINLQFYEEELAKWLVKPNSRTFSLTKEGKITECCGDPNSRNTSPCFGSCRNCAFANTLYRCTKARMNWLMEEHEEPEEIDWSKVPVGTPILVKRGAGDRQFKQYFRKYENGKISTWDDPERTHKCSLTWAPEYAKLA